MEQLEAAQQTAHEQPHIDLVWFAEFHFLSGIIRVSTLNVPMVWGGYTWMGLGSIADISALDERLGVASESITFTISLAQTDWLALAAGAAEEYRGRPAKLYHCPMDANYRLIRTPKRCWSGKMDQQQPSISTSGEPPVTSGSIILKCETSSHGINPRNPLRLNAAQHKVRYPLDTGFDRMTRLIGNQFPWISVRFQRR
jgi:hypothetical protein